jgi:hypothetical protein
MFFRRKEQNQVSNGLSLVVSVSFQLTSFLALCLFMVFFWYSCSRFTSSERVPIIRDNIFNKFNTSLLNVDVGLYINKFLTFDVTRNEFIIDGIVWFKFDPSKISLKVFDSIYFEQGEILIRSLRSVRFVQDSVFVQYDVRVKFKSSLDYHFYPFDDHALYLIMGLKAIGQEEISFRINSSDFVVIEDMEVFGWKEQKSNAYSGYFIHNLENNNNENKTIESPVIVFTASYLHIDLQKGLIIFLPLFIMFFLGMFSFSIDPIKFYTMILSISLATISAILGFRFVIESFSPHVGYLMLSDYFFFMFLVLAAIILVINFFGSQLRSRYKKLIILSLDIFIIVVLWHIMTILGV